MLVGVEISTRQSCGIAGIGMPTQWWVKEVESSLGLASIDVPAGCATRPAVCEGLWLQPGVVANEGSPMNISTSPFLIRKNADNRWTELRESPRARPAIERKLASNAMLVRSGDTLVDRGAF
jgi:hypothetical protein